MFIFSYAEIVIKGLKNSTDQWKDIEDMKKVLWFNKTPIFGTNKNIAHVHLMLQCNKSAFALLYFVIGFISDIKNKMYLPEYVIKHWKEDEFYGYQFLNATNPNVICRCSKLPSNFPVTEEMVKPFLDDGSSLQMEMMVWKSAVALDALQFQYYGTNAFCFNSDIRRYRGYFAQI